MKVRKKWEDVRCHEKERNDTLDVKSYLFPDEQRRPSTAIDAGLVVLDIQKERHQH